MERFRSIYGPPGLEAIPTGSQRARLGREPVGNHQHLVEDEGPRDVHLVCLELVEGVADRCLLLRRFFNSMIASGKSVHKHHYVRTPGGVPDTLTPGPSPRGRGETYPDATVNWLTTRKSLFSMLSGSINFTNPYFVARSVSPARLLSPLGEGWGEGAG